MSLPDQKILKHLLDLIPSSKEVVIIHNYYSLYSESAVEDYIKKDIYNGYFDYINEKQFNKLNKKHRMFLTSRQNIYHVVIANKFSKAGEVYNEVVFDFLRKKIQTLTIKSEINIEKKLFNFLNENIEKYIKGGEKNKILYEEKLLGSKIQIQNDLKNMNLQNAVLNSLGFVEFSNKKFNDLFYEILYNDKEFLMNIHLLGIFENKVESINCELFDVENNEGQIIHIKIEINNEKSENYNTFYETCNYSKKTIEFSSCIIPFNIIKIGNPEFEIEISDLGVISIKNKIKTIVKKNWKKNKNNN